MTVVVAVKPVAAAKAIGEAGCAKVKLDSEVDIVV